MRGNRRTVQAIRLMVPALALAILLAAATATAPRAQEEDLVARGQFLYRVYCKNCHGDTGRGDGPSAELLKIAPADLTRLARSGEGEFPFEQVYRTIDGRQEISGHGARRMPIWGLTFQELDRDVDQEDEVRGKILQLIRYLESIQQPAE